MPWATVLRNAAFGLELRGVPRKEREEAARAVRREGRVVRLRGRLSAPALRRYAATRRPRPGARGGRRHPADGRAVRVGRRADPPQVPGGPAAAAQRRAQDRDLRDPLDRGGGLRLRPDRDPDPRAPPACRTSSAPASTAAAAPTASGATRPTSTGSSRSGTSCRATSSGDMELRGHRVPMAFSLLVWFAIWEIVGRLELVSLLPPFTEVLAALPEVVSVVDVRRRGVDHPAGVPHRDGPVASSSASASASRWARAARSGR